MALIPTDSPYSARAGALANSDNLPKHVAIIMDGNGRWARQRGLPRTAGHRQGVETVRRIVKQSLDIGVEVLTLFAFGRENWRRPPQEVRNLQRLFLLGLHREVQKLTENGVKLQIIGERNVYPPQLVEAMNKAEAISRTNTRLTLNLAINYSGRWDIVTAVQKIAHLVKAGKLAPEAIDEAYLSSLTTLKNLPEPDLFIRTGGVQRLSNFILWEIAYTELYFTDTLWPDFNADNFSHALNSFSLRERRFGLTSQQVEEAEC